MKKTSMIHIGIISLIVIIALVSVYRLYRWNSGVTSDREADIEQVDPSEFDVEVNDMIIPLDSSRLEGHEPDEDLQILCLAKE